MNLDDAKQVTVPFGRCSGWPLEAVITRRFSEYAYLAWCLESGRPLFGEIKEALEALTRDAELVERLRQYRRQRTTAAHNRRRLNAWAMR